MSQFDANKSNTIIGPVAEEQLSSLPRSARWYARSLLDMLSTLEARACENVRFMLSHPNGTVSFHIEVVDSFFVVMSVHSGVSTED